MRLYVIRVDIREAATGYAYPIVTHEFKGRTREEAWGYHDAHRQADAFLRECEDKRLFRGNVQCVAELIEGWQDVFV
jgi:hypothetical protein